MIYLDNAATTRLCDEANSAMQPYLGESFFNVNSSYGEARTVRREIEEARESMARMIGASSGIYFTSGGSESDSWVILGTAMHYIAKKESVHIITSKIEHHAVLNSCKMAESIGATITYLGVNELGFVSEDELAKAIKPDTRVVSIMLVNNELGTINNIKSLCERTKQINKNIIFHTDAVQAFGNISVDVRELGVDAISLSAHKFHGPKGIGVLYCKCMDAISSIVFGGDQENGRRGGTTNTPGIIGMNVAARYSLENMELKKENCRKIRSKLIEILENSGLDFSVNGIKECTNEWLWPGIVNLCFDGISGERLIALLEHDGILCSKAAACDGNGNGLDSSRSHVLKAIGLNNIKIDGSVRLSFGVDTKEEDIEYIAGRIIERVNMLRKMG